MTTEATSFLAAVNAIVSPTLSASLPFTVNRLFYATDEKLKAWGFHPTPEHAAHMASVMAECQDPTLWYFRVNDVYGDDIGFIASLSFAGGDTYFYYEAIPVTEQV